MLHWRRQAQQGVNDGEQTNSGRPGEERGREPAQEYTATAQPTSGTAPQEGRRIAYGLRPPYRYRPLGIRRAKALKGGKSMIQFSVQMN